jgi:hypothetical protein
VSNNEGQPTTLFDGISSAVISLLAPSVLKAMVRSWTLEMWSLGGVSDDKNDRPFLAPLAKHIKHYQTVSNTFKE